MAFPALFRKLFANDGAGPKLKSSLIPGNYAVCSTAAATAAKTVTIDDFNLTEGAVAHVYFSNTNTNSAPTLNVNSTGAKSIRYNGAAYTKLTSSCVYSFIYDGTYWQLLSGGGASDVPIGTIVAFSGSFGGTSNRFPIPRDSSTPDTNWCLCDGTTTNGYTVPDLRNRFIVGAGSTYSSGNTGGSTTHTHSISGTVGSTTLSTSQMPSHTHVIVRSNGGSGTDYIGNGASPSGLTSNTNSTGGSSSHTHSLSSVSSTSASSLPPYYALSYIMRCA